LSICSIFFATCMPNAAGFCINKHNKHLLKPTPFSFDDYFDRRCSKTLTLFFSDSKSLIIIDMALYKKQAQSRRIFEHHWNLPKKAIRM
jgi:hypothetical protein